MNDIPDGSALRAHFGQVSPMAEKKVLFRLDAHCRRFIELSPFLVIATADADGRVDASPRGDPPGFVRVLDDTTLLLPDRPGNNRVDSFGNLLSNPGVGIIFFLPGVEETLRVNGTAVATTDMGLLAGSDMNGKVPKTGMLVRVQEAFFHCAKALKRSRLWDPAAQIERSAFPSLGRILADQQKVPDVAELEARLEVAYRERLY
jgi:PPOX class probable FMN-dependent enzyme